MIIIKLIFLIFKITLLIIVSYSASFTSYENINITDENAAVSNKPTKDNKIFCITGCDSGSTGISTFDNVTVNFNNPIRNDSFFQLLKNDPNCDLKETLTFFNNDNCFVMLEKFRLDFELVIINNLVKYESYLTQCDTDRYDSTCYSLGDYTNEAIKIVNNMIFLEYFCKCNNIGNNEFCTITKKLNVSALKLIQKISYFSMKKFANSDLKLLMSIQCDLLNLDNILFEHDTNCTNNIIEEYESNQSSSARQKEESN